MNTTLRTGDRITFCVRRGTGYVRATRMVRLVDHDHEIATVHYLSHSAFVVHYREIEEVIPHDTGVPELAPRNFQQCQEAWEGPLGSAVRTLIALEHGPGGFIRFLDAMKTFPRTQRVLAGDVAKRICEQQLAELNR